METGQATSIKEKETVIFCGIKPTSTKKINVQELLRKVNFEKNK